MTSENRNGIILSGNSTTRQVTYRQEELEFIHIDLYALSWIIEKFLQKYNGKYLWISTGALFLSLLITITTATFSEKYGITGDSWNTCFTLLAFASFLVFIYFLIKSIVFRGYNTEKLVEIMKGQCKKQTTNQ
ncbi:MAG: hypothetical protein RR506_09925 [Akkermansia sp.]